MGRASHFVGRADELAVFGDVFACAGEGTGEGGLVAVVGEAGVGKTALVEAAVASRPVVWAHAREGGGSPALWLWEQVLAEFGEVLPASPSAGDIGVDRFLTFDRLSRRLVDLHRTASFTVVLDDLQWADEESLAFVDFFEPDAQQHGIVVVATVRRGELAMLPSHTQVIELGGLPPSDVAQLISRGRHGPVDDDLIDEVWRHTGGNPLFIREVDRLLRTGGHHADAAHWRSIVPEGARSVLGRRLARLPQRANRTLQAAAELGERIEAVVLAAVLDRPYDDVIVDLDAAADVGLIVHADGNTSFAHSLIREVARAGLAPGQRAALNRRAADELLADPEPRAERIARHLIDAGDPTAPEWAARAGEEAYAASMYGQSAHWFECALESTPDDSPLLRLRLGEALARCGRADEAEGHFVQAANRARSLGEPRLFARAALGVGSLGGGFEVRQLDAAQQAMLSEAIEALVGVDSPLLAALQARLSVAMSLDGDSDTRRRLADSALATARRVHERPTIGAALGAWCDAHAGPAHVGARTTAATEMLTIARQTGDAELELLSRRLLIVANLEAGQIGLVERHSQAFSALADRLRVPQFTWYGRLIEATLAHLHGELERAVALATEASALGRRAHSANAVMLADGALLPAIHRDLGATDVADRMLAVNTAIPEATRGHDLTSLVPMFAVGYDASDEEITLALPGWTALWESVGPDDGLWLCLGYHLARGAALVGNSALMTRVEEVLEPHADLYALDGTGAVCYGPISAALAAMAAARDDRVRAERLYRRAIAACRRINAPLQRARFEHELAALAPRRLVPVRDSDRMGTFSRDGDAWLIGLDGHETHIKHTKGMTDLAFLLGHPERDIHVFDLIGAAPADRSDTGELIDADARTAYRERIEQLTADIAHAEMLQDDDRAAALDRDRAELIDELARSLGLAGRPRKPTGDVERARKAVSMRIRDVMRRIDAELPELGRHLHSSIRTGTSCSYRPDARVRWRLQPARHDDDR